jgi:DNA-directed RNA polymerase subunit beta'
LRITFESITPLRETALGRVSAEEIVIDSKVILKKNQLIDERLMSDLEHHKVENLKVRSVLMCENKFGVCAHCYGRDLSTGEMVNLGEAIGVIAAQSIGEPGTQLTMRTFHIGGAAQKIATKSDIIASYTGTIKLHNATIIKDRNGDNVNMSKNCQASILVKKTEKFKCKIPYGAKLNFSNNDKINLGDRLSEWDPYMTPIFSEIKGTASLIDLKEGVTMKETHDEATGVNKVVIIDNSKNKKTLSLRPRIVIKDKKGDIIKLENGAEAKYFLPINAIVNVTDNQEIEIGDVLAKISKHPSNTKP